MRTTRSLVKLQDSVCKVCALEETHDTKLLPRVVPGIGRIVDTTFVFPG
jgi:hypothetical protein